MNKFIIPTLVYSTGVAILVTGLEVLGIDPVELGIIRYLVGATLVIIGGIFYEMIDDHFLKHM